MNFAVQCSSMKMKRLNKLIICPEQHNAEYYNGYGCQYGKAYHPLIYFVKLFTQKNHCF